MVQRRTLLLRLGENLHLTLNNVVVCLKKKQIKGENLLLHKSNTDGKTSRFMLMGFLKKWIKSLGEKNQGENHVGRDSSVFFMLIISYDAMNLLSNLAKIYQSSIFE